MPILVTCPKCAAKLNAPDAAAGKAVRCPKAGCGTIVPVAALVAAEEEPVEAKAVSPPRPPVKAVPIDDDDDDDHPRKRSRRDDDEDDDDDRPRTRSRRRRDDDDDEDERPRKRGNRYGAARGRRRGGGGKTAAVVVAVLIGLAVLGGIGYGIYRLAGGGSGPPPGWKEYTYAGDNFKAYFPKQPDVNNVGGMGGGFGGAPGANVPQSMTTYLCSAFDLDAEARVAVIVVRYSSPPSAAEQKRLVEDFNKKEQKGGSTKRSVKWLGETAEETTGSEGTARIVFVGNTMYMAAVTGKGGRAKANVENGFFDNFQLLK